MTLLLDAHAQAKRGGLKDTDAVELLSTVFKAVIDKTGVDPRVCVSGKQCVCCSTNHLF
jgi:hypothetical protein